MADCLAELWLDPDIDVEPTPDDLVDLEVLFAGADQVDQVAAEWQALFPDDQARIDHLKGQVSRAFEATLALEPRALAGRDLGIADRLRAAGLRVVEINGWQTRGSTTFNPQGSVDHHTAGPAIGNAPSLNICINGRADLPGPLCHVLIGRDNTCYVIAAGRANHAGTGSWDGLSGNTTVFGIERENVGTTAEPWRIDQTETACQAHAALMERRSASRVCGHREWTPRKIDAHSVNYPSFRTRVAHYQQTPGPTPITNGEDTVYFLVQGHIDAAPGGNGRQYIADPLGAGTKRHMRTGGERDWFIEQVRANGGGVSTEQGGRPHIWGQGDVDALRNIGMDGVNGNETDNTWAWYSALPVGHPNNYPSKVVEAVLDAHDAESGNGTTPEPEPPPFQPTT